MTGRAVVTTRLSREAMKRASPVIAIAQIARDLAACPAGPTGGAAGVAGPFA